MPSNSIKGKFKKAKKNIQNIKRKAEKMHKKMQKVATGFGEAEKAIHRLGDEFQGGLKAGDTAFMGGLEAVDSMFQGPSNKKKKRKKIEDEWFW